MIYHGDVRLNNLGDLTGVGIQVGFLKISDHKQAVSGNTKGVGKLSQTIDWEWPLGTQGDSGLRIFAVINPEAIRFKLAQK
jgi:hypothetical protein